MRFPSIPPPEFLPARDDTPEPLERLLPTEVLQRERLEFFDLDPGNPNPRHLVLEPAAVLGYYLIFLDGRLIWGEWEITSHRIDGDIVYLQLENRRPTGRSPRNLTVEILACEGTRLMVTLGSEIQIWETGEWRRDWRREY